MGNHKKDWHLNLFLLNSSKYVGKSHKSWLTIFLVYKKGAVLFTELLTHLHVQLCLYVSAKYDLENCTLMIKF